MDQELKARWVAALRSGEYEQGTGQLGGAGKYCCLGVLCKIARPELEAAGVPVVETEGLMTVGRDGDWTVPSRRATELLGLPSSNGVLPFRTRGAEDYAADHEDEEVPGTPAAAKAAEPEPLAEWERELLEPAAPEYEYHRGQFSGWIYRVGDSGAEKFDKSLQKWVPYSNNRNRFLADTLTVKLDGEPDEVKPEPVAEYFRGDKNGLIYRVRGAEVMFSDGAGGWLRSAGTADRRVR